jgi:hypothetical protein
MHRLLEVQRPTGKTTRKGPRLRVRPCRWRKRLLLHWRHRPKRYRLPVRVLRRALVRRGLARFGRSVYLISKPILRRCYSQLSGRQSLAQGSRLSDCYTTRMRESMVHFVFGTALAVMFSVPFVAISYNAAVAQGRDTCSQARSQCGTQPVCQRRYQACMETGCWTVGPLKRCGYLQQ